MVTTAGAKEVRSNSQVRISRKRPIGEIALLVLGILALLGAFLVGVPSAKGQPIPPSRCLRSQWAPIIERRGTVKTFGSMDGFIAGANDPPRSDALSQSEIGGMVGGAVFGPL